MLALSYDDVLIVPQLSDIASREDIDLSQDFFDYDLKLPFISANMDYITGESMALAMLTLGAFYIFHRFEDIDLTLDHIDGLTFNVEPHSNFRVSFSVGTKNLTESMLYINRIHSSFTFTFDSYITIDVAHGHHTKVKELIKRVREEYPRSVIIAGNVATRDGASYLADAGANAIKIGIGPGAACTTRIVTGTGIPQFTAIRNATSIRASYPDVKFIADGGIRSSGDIVKALAAGADTVILGSIIAGTDETPGETRVGPDNSLWRPYRGQSVFGSNRDKYVPEGVSGWVKSKGPVTPILRQLAAGVRSGLSYVGARNLTELRENAEFVQQTAAGLIESNHRLSNLDE